MQDGVDLIELHRFKASLFINVVVADDDKQPFLVLLRILVVHRRGAVTQSNSVATPYRVAFRRSFMIRMQTYIFPYGLVYEVVVEIGHQLFNFNR